VLLLGYLGIFETTTLDPYLEIGNKLHEYVEAYKNISNKTEQLKIIEILREELEIQLKKLANSSEKDL
jgi:ABC-type microcin C transport system duplicated ATPase subunit YejF